MADEATPTPINLIDERLYQLPPIVNVGKHAELLCEAYDISRVTLYRKAPKGELGWAPLKIGTKLCVRRVDLLAALGLDGGAR